MKDLITVITVTYNCVNVIEETILSVLNQTYSNVEYIIIDGGSIDGTLDVIKKYNDKISYWISEPDRGVYDAMNKGIINSHGEWLNFMNAGDTFYNQTLLYDIFSMQIPNEISFLYSDYALVDAKKKITFDIASISEGKILHQASIYRRKLHDWYGMYIVSNPIVISDFLFFCSIPKNEYMKVPYYISKFDTTGISNQGNWCYLQISCARFIFSKLSYDKLFMILLKEKIHYVVPKWFWNFYQRIKCFLLKK